MKKNFALIMLMAGSLETAFVQGIEQQLTFVSNCAASQYCSCNPCLCGASCQCGTRTKKESTTEQLVAKICNACSQENFKENLQTTVYPSIKRFFSRVVTQAGFDEPEKQWITSLFNDFNSLIGCASSAHQYEEKYLRLIDEQEKMLAKDLDEMAASCDNAAISELAQKRVEEMTANDPDFEQFCLFKNKLACCENKVTSIEHFINELPQGRKDQLINCYFAMMQVMTQAIIDAVKEQQRY